MTYNVWRVERDLDTIDDDFLGPQTEEERCAGCMNALREIQDVRDARALDCIIANGDPVRCWRKMRQNRPSTFHEDRTNNEFP